MANDNVTLFWHNDTDLHVKIGDKSEVINATDALEKYGDNKIFLQKYNNLIKTKKGTFVNKEQKLSENHVIKFDNKNDDSAIDLFKSKYEILVNELKYDEPFADNAKKEDKLNNLSAWEIKKKDIARTKEQKKGVCTTFTFRLQDELDKLGIENYLLIINSPNLVHFANLYIINDKYYICDITRDITYANLLRENGLDIETIPPMSFQIPLPEYLKDYTNSTFFIPEKIINNSKKIEELSTIPLSEFMSLRKITVSNQSFDDTREFDRFFFEDEKDKQIEENKSKK